MSSTPITYTLHREKRPERPMAVVRPFHFNMATEVTWESAPLDIAIWPSSPSAARSPTPERNYAEFEAELARPVQTRAGRDLFLPDQPRTGCRGGCTPNNLCFNCWIDRPTSREIERRNKPKPKRLPDTPKAIGKRRK
jgi:hypothetical protein